MLLHDYLLAAALLTPPLGASEFDVGSEALPALRVPLQALALEWEILDPRETGHLLIRPGDFRSDLSLLRRRYHDLADAPHIYDAQRFPHPTTVNAYLAFNRAYRLQIDVGKSDDSPRGCHLRTALQKTDQLYEIWDTVRDSRCEHNNVTVRRHALKRLREMLGDEDYYAARLPPFVPLWRFHDMP